MNSAFLLLRVMSLQQVDKKGFFLLFPVGDTQASCTAQASQISAGQKLPFIPWRSGCLLCDQAVSVSEQHPHRRMWWVTVFQAPEGPALARAASSSVALPELSQAPMLESASMDGAGWVGRESQCVCSFVFLPVMVTDCQTSAALLLYLRPCH